MWGVCNTPLPYRLIHLIFPFSFFIFSMTFLYLLIGLAVGFTAAWFYLQARSRNEVLQAEQTVRQELSQLEQSARQELQRQLQTATGRADGSARVPAPPTCRV